MHKKQKGYMQHACLEWALKMACSYTQWTWVLPAVATGLATALAEQLPKYQLLYHHQSLCSDVKEPAHQSSLHMLICTTVVQVLASTTFTGCHPLINKQYAQRAHDAPLIAHMCVYTP